MKNFIPAVRTDRFREMKAYEEKGYCIQDKNSYIKSDKIDLIYMNKKYTYGIEITKNEIYFYIIQDSANVYLSISEIYDILCVIDHEVIVDAMKKQLINSKEFDVFWYREIQYKVSHIVSLIEDKKFVIPQSGMEILYSELFILINFIQEKSNTLFRRSTASNKKYIKGILRLLIALCEKEENVPILEELGWVWNDKEKKFYLEMISKREGRNKYKYYLTKDEYESIMNEKKS